MRLNVHDDGIAWCMKGVCFDGETAKSDVARMRVVGLELQVMSVVRS